MFTFMKGQNRPGHLTSCHLFGWGRDTYFLDVVFPCWIQLSLIVLLLPTFRSCQFRFQMTNQMGDYNFRNWTLHSFISFIMQRLLQNSEGRQLYSHLPPLMRYTIITDIYTLTPRNFNHLLFRASALCVFSKFRFSVTLLMTCLGLPLTCGNRHTEWHPKRVNP